MDTQKTLICVVGATASGKTELAITLAKHFKTEIISADSRQFYKELNIGTAKPSKEELDSVPHHFINTKSITETYSAGDFEVDALKKIDNLFLTHNHVILVGGSGMYIDAVVKGFDPLPKASAEIRATIIEQFHTKGILFLQHEIQRHDPEYYSKVDTQNPQRLMRALEVIYSTGKPFSDFHNQSPGVRNFNCITLGTQWERDILYDRINRRVDFMIREGLEQEVKQFESYKDNYAMRSVGYSEFFDYFAGKQNKETTIALIKQHTRNFAKRQLTWFRRDVNTQWINPSNEKAIFAAINPRTDS